MQPNIARQIAQAMKRAIRESAVRTNPFSVGTAAIDPNNGESAKLMNGSTVQNVGGGSQFDSGSQVLMISQNGQLANAGNIGSAPIVIGTQDIQNADVGPRGVP